MSDLCPQRNCGRRAPCSAGSPTNSERRSNNTGARSENRAGPGSRSLSEATVSRTHSPRRWKRAASNSSHSAA